MIKAILFDWGSTLSRGVVKKMFTLIGEQCGKSWYEVHALARPYLIEINLGHMSYDEFWEALSKKTGVADLRVPKQMYLEVAWNPEMQTLVKTLNKNYTLGLLSNNYHEKAALLRQDETLAANFDFLLFSCETGFRKPEKKFYHIAVEHTGVKPEEVLFIDDKYANVVGAKEAGLQALHFTGIKRLLQDLNKVGVDV